MRLFFCCFSLIWLGAGCFSVGMEPTLTLSVPETREDRVLSVERGRVQEGIEVVRAGYSTSGPGTLLLFGFDQDLFRFRFAATGTRLNVRDWMGLSPQAVAGINGTYFHEDLLPSGFFVTDGFMQRRRVFDLDASALVLLGAQMQLIDTKHTPIDLQRVRHGAQTYPVLIRDGVGAVGRDSGKVARRSWVGTDREGRVWMGVLSDGQATLHGLMQRLLELGISWEMVVNLDGGPSTGLFVRGVEEVVRETFGGVPNVLLVERRNK